MKTTLLNPASFYLPEKVERKVAEENKGDEKGFGEILEEKLEEVNSLQKKADRITEDFLAGKPVELHEVMLSMEKASLALQLTVEIRNKLVEAYKEISRIQL